ncbi:MAG: hypothetical protein CVV02_14710 [Firmicutes bacterium HGW-Firmicutes-7]|nr:MAG: hypothetical protein CVV02_14710 [Firmicutes bacterium HGW-Firmicutes-7]
MFFSEYFGIDQHLLSEYGAVDISLVCDMPLFIDPMLIFNSDKPEHKKLHKEIIRYFHFLATKANSSLQENEIRAWFMFSEVKNNWLGYSLSGNGGLALGERYAQFLYNNIGFAISTNNISQSTHIEKIMLLYSGSGKDKISDLTVNLIKEFLLEYTQTFAINYIDDKLKKRIYVDRAYFNYETESFANKDYVLPFFINVNGMEEFILLTPFYFLREGEPSINRDDFIKNQERIRASIDNDVLRAYVNNYIFEAVRRYEEQQQRNKRRISERSISKIEKDAFSELTHEYPELYDYYIRLRELDTPEIRAISTTEVNYQLEKFLKNTNELISAVIANGYKINEALSAREEAIQRLKFFKHVIEDCDGYKNLYSAGKRISTEDDIRRMFRLVWYDTTYKVDFDTNNGRGEADVIVSKGQYNQNITEFKLASNSSLPHVFEQLKVYEAANCADGSLVAIFFFTENEFEIAKRVVKNAGYEDQVNKAIFLIDCRADNKPSASRTK